MRWNCPHCSETVSLGIDIEQVKRAYVRCGACKGVALIQTRASYADHQAVKPQAETVLRSDPHGNVTIGIETHAPEAPAKIARPAHASVPAPTVSSLGSHMVGASRGHASAPTPMNALPSNMPPVPGSGATAARTASGNFDVTPPPFNPQHMKPPAFLLRENPIPMPIQFSTKDDVYVPNPRANERMLRLAVASATVAAILSGLYLFYQGQKLM